MLFYFIKKVPFVLQMFLAIADFIEEVDLWHHHVSKLDFKNRLFNIW